MSLRDCEVGLLYTPTKNNALEDYVLGINRGALCMFVSVSVCVWVLTFFLVLVNVCMLLSASIIYLLVFCCFFALRIYFCFYIYFCFDCTLKNYKSLHKQRDVQMPSIQHDWLLFGATILVFLFRLVFSCVLCICEHFESEIKMRLQLTSQYNVYVTLCPVLFQCGNLVHWLHNNGTEIPDH